MTNNVVLVGFMGVGKGRTARALAQLTNGFAVDTDDLIESFAKAKIRSLFAEQGEPAFRRLEQQVADWLERQVQATIISTGGGFFMVNNIRRLGTIFYLHSALPGILSRIQSHPQAQRKIKKRPLLANMEKAGALYRHRLPLYRQVADHEINVEGKRSSDVAAEILGRLTQRG